MDVANFTREVEGISSGQWVGDLRDMGDVKLKVRGLTSPLVVNVRSRKERKVPKQDRERDGTLRTDVALRIFGEVLFEVVLLDWSGITSNGEPLPYDKETAYAWCTDPRFTMFADAVTAAANIVDRGMAAAEEQLTGNLPKPSAGNSKEAPAPEAS